MSRSHFTKPRKQVSTNQPAGTPDRLKPRTRHPRYVLSDLAKLKGKGLNSDLPPITGDERKAILMGLSMALDMRMRNPSLAPHQHVEIADYAEGLTGDTTDTWVYAASQEWPSYSGNPLYPVPATSPVTAPKSEEAKNAYSNAQARREFYSGPYGMLQLSLVRFLFTKLTGVTLEDRPYSYGELEPLWNCHPGIKPV